jgi:serine/threonine protein kinase
LLTGQAPFHGKTETQKLLAHQREEPPPIAQFRPEIPKSVVAIVKKMMAKDPSRRYATMSEVAHACRETRGGAVHRTRGGARHGTRHGDRHGTSCGAGYSAHDGASSRGRVRGVGAATHRHRRGSAEHAMTSGRK